MKQFGVARPTQAPLFWGHTMQLEHLDALLDIVNRAFAAKAESYSPQHVGTVFSNVPWVMPDLRMDKHTAIYGRKGTGKSMLLKYLSMPVQASIHGEERDVRTRMPCFGLNVVLATGSLPKCRHTSASNPDYLKLFTHWYNLRIADAALEGLVSLEELPHVKTSLHVDKALKVLGGGIGMPCIAAARDLGAAHQQVRSFTRRLYEYVASQQSTDDLSVRSYCRFARYKGAFHAPDVFMAALCECLQDEAIVGFDVPVFVLLDQWDALLPMHREILFPLFEKRSPQAWFMKIGSVMPYDGLLPSVPADELDVREIEADPDGEGYRKFCRGALMARFAFIRSTLSSAGATDDMLRLFDDPDRLLPFLSIADQYKAFITEKRHTPQMFSQFRDPEFTAFSEMARINAPPLYCGVETMIRLSSGIPRAFLELVYRSLKEGLSTDPSPLVIGHIPHQVQDACIRHECKELLDQKLKADVMSFYPSDAAIGDAARTWARNVSRQFAQSMRTGSEEPTLHRILVRRGDVDGEDGTIACKLATALIRAGILTVEAGGLSEETTVYRVTRAFSAHYNLPLKASSTPLELTAIQFCMLSEDTPHATLAKPKEKELLLTQAFFATAFRENAWQDAVRKTLATSIFSDCGWAYYDGEPLHDSSSEIGGKVRDRMRSMQVLLFDITDENENVCFEWGMGLALSRYSRLLLNTSIPGAVERQKKSLVFPLEYIPYVWPDDQRVPASEGPAFHSLKLAVSKIAHDFSQSKKREIGPLGTDLRKEYGPIPGTVYVYDGTNSRMSTWRNDIHTIIRGLTLAPAYVPAVSKGITLLKHLEAAARADKCIVDISACDRLGCTLVGFLFMRAQPVLAVYDSSRPGQFTNWKAEDANRAYASKDELLDQIKNFLQV
jgi:hypothetical protein